VAIKVFMQTDKFKGGPAIFRSRLISALNKFEDIKVINNINEKFDIELAFIRKVYKHNKPYVLRVDGCYYQKNKASQNRPLQKAIMGSKYLIFQSNFSFELCKKVLDIGGDFKDGKNYSIIHNGIDLDYIKKIIPSRNIKQGSFVSAARWRDNKRTFSMLKGFLKANTGRHLYIMGGLGMGESRNYLSKVKDFCANSECLHFLGEKSPEETISIIKACDYQIHLCHIDSCPNVVLEGLSCGLKVLCTNLGGTKELVGDNGVVLKVDKMWDGKFLSSSTKLDSLNKKDVSRGINKLMTVKSNFDVKKIDINEVAEKYVNIIRKVI
jgi:glycosyltransferase involved in cell wall biosynthesis